MVHHPDLARALRRASNALQQGDLADARTTLEALRGADDRHPDRLHLLGLVNKAEGHLDAAEQCLRAALAGNRQPASVLNNLGNLLKQKQRLEEAEQAYRQALRAEPAFLDAKANLGLLLAAQGRDEEAVTLLEAVVEVRSGHVAGWTTLGQSYRRLGDFDRSMVCFERALAVRPGYGNALAGLGQTLRMLGRPARASEYFDLALQQAGGSVDLLVARADVAADQCRYDEALARYRHAIEIAPNHVGAHTQLSELLWQTGAAAHYGESFRQALEKYPHEPALLAAWCEGLVNTGAADDALRELQARPDLVAENPVLLLELGKCLAARQQNDSAAAAFRQALRLSPQDPGVNLMFAQFAIYGADYVEALAALEVAERANPDDQLVWACRGLCWRLMGDERAAWLNDEARLIRTYEIQPPPRYASLDSFLSALAEALTAMHRTQAAPAHQSLRGGTQTAPRLFYRPDPVIQDLRLTISKIVEQYIRDLSEDHAHPMLRRRSRRFRFSGSWSVRLRSGGYHVNHVHPQGWISSSHYVTVPADLGASPGDPKGWLKFGESSLGLGEREQVSRLVKPEPGQVTLFPSYFWHGTVPFASAEPRLTTPFDVVPSG